MRKKKCMASHRQAKVYSLEHKAKRGTQTCLAYDPYYVTHFGHIFTGESIWLKIGAKLSKYEGVDH